MSEWRPRKPSWMAASSQSPTGLEAGLLGCAGEVGRPSRSCAEDAHPGSVLLGAHLPCLSFLGVSADNCQKVFLMSLALGRDEGSVLSLTRLFSSPVSRLLLCQRLVPLLVLRVGLSLAPLSTGVKPHTATTLHFLPEQNPKFHWSGKTGPLE